MKARIVERLLREVTIELSVEEFAVLTMSTGDAEAQDVQKGMRHRVMVRANMALADTEVHTESLRLSVDGHVVHE